MSQPLQNQFQLITPANQHYIDNHKRWLFYLESYMGGDDYRNGNHLTRYQLETDGEYAARIRATPLDNHCRSVVNVFNSFLFREQPERELGTLAMEANVEDFLKDADLEGRSLDSVMKDVATWSSVFGHVWLIMSKPNINAITMADELAVGVRPYISLLTPLVVYDWRYERQPSGLYEITYFKYVEDSNDNQLVTVVEWTRDEIITTQMSKSSRQATAQTVEVNQLGRIPVVIAYNQRSSIRGIGISDLTDISDQQKAIYNELSEIEQAIRLDSHPTLVTPENVKLGTGAGAIVYVPETLDPGLKPYVLQNSGADVTAIYSSIQNRIQAIDKMANTGAVRATEARTMSGVAMETEFQLLNARLSEKADNLELAEEQLWKLYAQYQGTVYDGEIDYPGSFNIRDTQSEIEQLVKVKSAATDPRVLELLDHELIEFLGEDADLVLPETTTLQDGTQVPLDSAEVFEEPEELYNPATGERGWVIDFTSKREAMLAGWVEVE